MPSGARVIRAFRQITSDGNRVPMFYEIETWSAMIVLMHETEFEMNLEAWRPYSRWLSGADSKSSSRVRPKRIRRSRPEIRQTLGFPCVPGHSTQIETTGALVFRYTVILSGRDCMLTSACSGIIR